MEQIIELVSQGVLQPFCNLLKTKEVKTVLVVLDGLTNILQVSFFPPIRPRDKVVCMLLLQYKKCLEEKKCQPDLFHYC